MKTIDHIPISKVQRASKIAKTGAKVGVNYIKYLGDKLVNTEEEARERLDQSNAEDIYDGLKDLKGSALKVAQMMSMDQNVLPQAYVEKFSLSQFSVPALSLPLVIKVFRSSFGKEPSQMFDSFSKEAVNAASIGQVHRAEKDGKSFAVKIQYPGVADSVSSDLALIKPVALKMFNIEKKGSEKYFKEVEEKLLEETDYELELRNSLQISKECQSINNVIFPGYYPEYSSKGVLTMDWMKGQHLSEFTSSNPSQEHREKVGQALWDLFMHQIHVIRKVHADPHPGNFLISKDNDLVVLDFGCVKEIPDDFYGPYFALLDKDSLENPKVFNKTLDDLEIIKPSDSDKDKVFLRAFFKEVLTLFTLPFHDETFDFSNDDYFMDVARLAEGYSKDQRLRKIDVNRGSKHFIYINRVFFGLYNLMNMIRPKQTQIHNYRKS